MDGKLIVTINDDGTIGTNATGLKGTTAEIMKELSALAASVGGALEVEKHEPGRHVHHHGDDKVHSHG